MITSKKNWEGREVIFFFDYFFLKCVFHACFMLIFELEGQKKIRVGILLVRPSQVKIYYFLELNLKRVDIKTLAGVFSKLVEGAYIQEEG